MSKQGNPPFTGPVTILAQLTILIPWIAVGVRRLHDVNMSGWWMLIAAIPLVNLILLVPFCRGGTSGTNRFGDDPLIVFDVALLGTKAGTLLRRD